MTTPQDYVRDHAVPLAGRSSDYDRLLDEVGERSLVLLGEASHGTAEFYRMRAEITRRLIREKGFEAVIVEADWPDALRLNRYVRGEGDDTLKSAFDDFQRFPQWMWRNTDVRDFIGWLAEHNAGKHADEQVGFHGLDVYSLHRSAEAVIEYLEGIDPEQARIAREGYGCLDHGGDPVRYGHDAAFGLSRICEDAAVRLLADLLEKSGNYLHGDGRRPRDEQFFAEQNARVVVNAEHYYRAMFGSRVDTWNLRDEHMTDTIAELREHLRRQGGQGKLVVWAHNSHLGDAAFTDMGWHRGQHNVGQLVRHRFGTDQALLVGFTTHSGFVSAARDWDGPVEHRKVRPSMEGSVERLFHDSGRGDFYLPLGEGAAPLKEPLWERAIGVIYRPESERISHYFKASMARQFDAVFHVDETRAVEPFDRGEQWHPEEAPDTYPFGV
ncbi:erythromycin esterase family protein [Billgrantia sulfidoxydans]|uniref:Erythromycin esterase family protein n=1 Tax=Billgrantia sulfidoxydans TaxID=2733484 RepID=A0ABX7W7T7_9GAMM|nr:erythromycin esterase family protein [Halomonas sulfidoxydans]QTP55830.1 erythromycin esterase family protein [Halomonas sulfidoxydans]